MVGNEPTAVFEPCNYTPVIRTSSDARGMLAADLPGAPAPSAQWAGRFRPVSVLVAVYSATSGMARALVLNATDHPLAVVPARRAVVLVLKDKAEVVASNGLIFRSERLTMAAPAVVRLRYFVRIPYRAHAALTRRAVFARDGWVCQYCGRPAENVDHVVPRSRGGTHTWDNVVAACRRCNSRKENRLHTDIGLRLARQPFAPSDSFRLSLGRPDPEWEPYLA